MDGQCQGEHILQKSHYTQSSLQGILELHVSCSVQSSQSSLVMLDYCNRFDEHSQKDLPAMLDYVLKMTKQDKLFYVGHSQGTVMGFAGFTFSQTLARHIHTFFALAPVTTVKHVKGLFKFISDFRAELAVSVQAGTLTTFS